MKSLKILLMLAVFALTVSGSSYDVKPQIDNSYQINKEELKISTGGTIKEKAKLRPMG